MAEEPSEAAPPQPVPPVQELTAPTKSATSTASPEIAPPPPAAPGPPAGPPAYDPKVFSAGAWLRLGGRIQNPTTPNELNDFFLDQLYLIVSFRGQMTDWLKWQINLNADVPPNVSNVQAQPSYPSVGIQDLIAKIEPHPLFNLWVGRMLVAVDRSNLSGPWFLNYWLYTGFFGNRAGPPIGLKTGRNGRDNGVTAWGQVGGGKFKYFLSAFNLDSRSETTSPLWSGRLVLDLLDPEPGYYNQSSYFGDKDIIAIGAGFQYQKNGSYTVVTPAMGTTPAVLGEVGDLKILEVDLLIDKRLGAAGVATLDASAYFYDDIQPVKRFYNVGASYVLPFAVGVGRVAPAVRYQFTQDPGISQIDGYLQYLIKGHFAKFFAGFFFTDLGNGTPTQKAIQFGVQLIKL
jgi:hypothetical protein